MSDPTKQASQTIPKGGNATQSKPSTKTGSLPDGTKGSFDAISAKVDPTDMSFFLDNMRPSDIDAFGDSPYKFRDPEQAKFWRPIWFPVSRYMNSKQALLSRGVVLVEKGGSILTVPFSGPDGLLQDCSFDPTSGRVHSKNVKRNDQAGGIYEPEWWLCLQPKGANDAMHQRMVERVKEKTERKATERTAEERAEMYKVAHDAGAKQGAVQIQNYEGDSGEGWENP